MLRLLSIRDFVVVSALELEPGFTVLTGETGAGKSILLDALGLLLGDRFEPRQIRAGAERAELAAAFDVDDAPSVRAWLAEEGLAESDGEVLLRRVLDAQGRSRAWINGSPATLAQLKALWWTRSAGSQRSPARPRARGARGATHCRSATPRASTRGARRPSASSS